MGRGRDSFPPPQRCLAAAGVAEAADDVEDQQSDQGQGGHGLEQGRPRLGGGDEGKQSGGDHNDHQDAQEEFLEN